MAHGPGPKLVPVLLLLRLPLLHSCLAGRRRLERTPKTLRRRSLTVGDCNGETRPPLLTRNFSIEACAAEESDGVDNIRDESRTLGTRGCADGAESQDSQSGGVEHQDDRHWRHRLHPRVLEPCADDDHSWACPLLWFVLPTRVQLPLRCLTPVTPDCDESILANIRSDLTLTFALTPAVQAACRASATCSRR